MCSCSFPPPSAGRWSERPSRGGALSHHATLPQAWRESPEALRQLPILTPLQQQITLGDVAEVRVASGPSMLKTENARPASWIYIDARGRDMVSVVEDLKTAIRQQVTLAPGTSVSFSGQFELLEHANRKLMLMVPMTLVIIFILLYLAFRRVEEALLILMSLPFALVGASGSSTGRAFICRSPPAPASSPWPVWPPSLAW